MAKLSLVAALLLIVFTFSSCNILSDTMDNNILNAPVLNRVQKEIYAALEATLDTSTIVYKYPESGEQRSPFVLYDINMDGEDEVVIFYSYADNPLETFAKILVKEKESWRDFYQISILGERVEFVEFAPLFSVSESSLIIGWNNSSTGHHVGIYSMQENAMRTEIEGTFTSHTVTDLDNDGKKELFLIERTANAFVLNYYYLLGERLMLGQSIPLYEETSNVMQAVVGTLPDGGMALYIDEEWRSISVSYATEVFRLSKDRMSVVAGSVGGKQPVSESGQWQELSKTFRYERVISRELYGDGTIYVPRLSEYSDNAMFLDNGDENQLVDYMILGSDGFSVSATAVINRGAGYMVLFPERWLGNVIIVSQKQRQEWRFHMLDHNTHEPSTELFRIRTYRSGDFLDEYAKDDLQLGVQGLITYYGTIPQTENNPLAVTAEEATAMFLVT